jgi:putative alpha-1,2-mannosidase
LLLVALHPGLAARRVRDYKPLGARSYRGGPISNPEEWVNTLGGTKAIGGQEDSFGNILPEVTYPWGFNGWTAQTTMDTSGWFFHSEARNIYGVRCTKQPSPWM